MKEEIIKKISELENIKIESLEELEKFRLDYLGKKGIVNEYMKKLGSLNDEERKELGKVINTFKVKATELFESLRSEISSIELKNKLESESIDVTLPETKINVGIGNILENLILELENTFISLGFDVVEGPEVESDLYNFEMLNLPIGHPARDEQDTFYITENMLLRSQTSPVQVRTMLDNTLKGPLRIVCPGKTYRRDNDDATHSHQFTQMEGLLIDENVSLANLKATMDIIAKKLFGEIETRFRPSYYPFTEPSVEFDVRCFKCGGSGCDICKHTGWITVSGAGMVHPNVLKNAGYDPNKYTGFAFGLGIERLAMLKYGISDIRTFYTNDLRSVKQFKSRED